MKLTDEQKKLVEENHNLIYWYTNKYNLDPDEWYSRLAIELCYSIMKHDPERSTLATYFKIRADGMMCKEYRKAKAKKRIPYESMYNENLHALVDDRDLIKEVEIQEWLSGVDSDIVRLKLDGLSQTEIARELGISQSQVSKTIKKLKVNYETNYKEK